MSYGLKEAPEKLETGSKCQHYWVIEGARGSISRGMCKLCGEEREFYNSWPPDLAVVKQGMGVFESLDSPDTESGEEREELALEKSSASL